MTRQELVDQYGDEEVLFMDPPEIYDPCILGVCHQFGRPVVVAYDLDLVLQALVRMGMTQEEADEFWSFNQVGAWMGERTPVFVQKIVGDQHAGQATVRDDPEPVSEQGGGVEP
jgi:hypothetical protein